MFSTHLRPLRSLQNNVLHVLTENNRDPSIRHKFDEGHILPIAGLFRFYNAGFMFKYASVSLPEDFRKMFTNGVNFHNYPIRVSPQVR